MNVSFAGRAADPGHGINMSQQEWKTIEGRLTRYAQSRIQSTSHPLSHTVDARTASDFVQGAVEKWLAGDRKWNRQSCPSFFMFLKGIVRSDLSEAFRRSSRVDLYSPGSADWPVSRAQIQPESPFWDEEGQLLRQKVEQEIYRRDDRVLAECWIGFLHSKRPREISEDTGLPIAAVYNGQRRLQYLFEGLKPWFFQSP